MARAIIGGIVLSTLVRVPVFSVLMEKLRDSSGRFLKLPDDGGQVTHEVLVKDVTALSPEVPGHGA